MEDRVARAPESANDFEVDVTGAPSIEDEVRVEQVLLLSRHIPAIVVGNLVNVVLTVSFFWSLGPRWLLVLWLATITAFSADRLRSAKRNRGKPRPARIAKSVIDRTIRVSIGAGLLWGIFSAAVFPPDSVPHQLLLCFVVGGMAAGALASLGSIPAAANGYVAASLLPLIARMALVATPLHLAMVAMLGFYGVILMVFARSVHFGIVDGAVLRVKNAGLVAATAQSNRALTLLAQRLANDLDELRAAEAKVRRLDTLLANAIDTIDDAVSLFDAEDRLVLTNRTLRDRFRQYPDLYAPGRSYEEFIRDYYTICEPGLSQETIDRLAEAALERHHRADGVFMEFQTRDGVWFLVRSFRTDEGGILTISTDVTATKVVEGNLARARKLLVDAMEASGDGMILFDADGRLQLVNKAMETFFSAGAEVFRPGRTFQDINEDLRHAVGWLSGNDRAPEELRLHAEQFRIGDGVPNEVEIPDGRWFLVRYFRTSDEGVLSLVTDITEWKRSAAELVAARDAADTANQAKSAFLASMSHEIRTPLNGVLGFAELLLDSELSDDQRRLVIGLRDAGKSLAALINDILDISKIEAGKLELEAIAMSPAAIIDGAASILRAQIAAKGLELRVDCYPSVPAWIVGDPTRVRQVLLNLISNALKFTEAGRILIRCGAEAGSDGMRLRFEVEDTGMGIPDDRRAFLFKDFSQLDPSTTRRYGGSGLGLSICKRLVEAMGGEIGVRSRATSGSVFWFTIGLVASEPPDAARLEVVSAKHASPARVLVAEDLPMNQVIVEGMLNRLGHRVVLVDNGAEAVAAVQASYFDLILMDMEMPVMDGISATRAIRRLGEGSRRIPIIALTANAMLEEAAACKTAGMDDFLSKPIDRADLAAMIARWSGATSASADKPVEPSKPVSLFDARVLDALEDALGSEKVADFCRTLGQHLEMMRPVFEACQDRAAMAKSAHNLISLAGNVGCAQLVSLARRLSEALKKDAPDVPDVAAALVDAADDALAALDRKFAA